MPTGAGKAGAGAGNAGVAVVHDPVDRYVAAAVRGSIILMGGAGILLYLKSSKTFRQFRHVREIPADYFKKGVELKGIVRDITANSTLKVEHVPRVRIPRPFGPRYSKTPPLLNVRLAGLHDIQPTGKAQLGKITNRRILFTPIEKSAASVDAVDAEVSLKKSSFLPSTNLNTELVRQGFAKVYSADNPDYAKLLQANRGYARLVTRLLACENVADRRGIGNWKRTVWVESLESLPSTVVQLIRGNAVTKLVVLCYNLLMDLATVGLIVLKQGFYLGKTLFDYLCLAYARFVLAVEGLSRSYTRLKSRLQGKGGAGGGAAAAGGKPGGGA